MPHSFPRHKGQGGAGKGVIHDAVKLGTVEPLYGLGPNFADDVGFRVDGFDAIAKLPPKALGLNLIGHI
jgi:hypothetical protein